MNFVRFFKPQVFIGLIGLLVSAGHLVTSAYAADDQTTIKIGTMEGEESDVWDVAKKVAQQQGLNLDIIHYSDYAIPNEALNSGEIDANAFQHKPYLEEQINQRGYKLSVVGYTVLYPIGIYSHKIKDIKNLKIGAKIGVPNDPTNEARSLRLLASLKLITLRDPSDIQATKYDIVDNPKNLDIQELDAGMLGRAIDDFDIIVINTNWALTTKLDPDKDAIYWESAQNNPYDNVIVVRTADINKPWVKKLVAAYNSEPVRAEIKRIFGATAKTSW